MVVFEVNEVTLYKMGVGWLSSRATCEEKDVLFPVLVRNQDDFLKTFHVDIEGEAMLSSIAFDTDSSKSIEIDQKGNALASILNLLSGSKVKIGALEGKLIGYQYVESENGKDNMIVLLMTEDLAIHPIPAETIEYILPAEEYFIKNLSDQIDLLSKSKKENVKNIKISFTEEGKKVVNVSYLTELPAWLSTYRIYAIDEKNVMFELWSLVTNNSQQDWIDAKVHLITGLPISFRYDVSSPWLIDRPYVERPRQTGISVMTPETSYELREEMAPPAPTAAPGRGLARMKKSMAKEAMVGGAADLDDLYEYEPAAEVSADIVDTTESVSFSLKQLVTIKKGESAFLLLHSKQLPKETINIYNKNQHVSHPFKAIVVENLTGYGWEAGPVTIYEKGNYAGEAMLDKVPKEEKQIIPYLVEQDISIKQIEDSTTKKIGISLSDHYYVEAYLNETFYKLEIDNKSDEEKTMICEVPKLYGYKIDKKKYKIETKETANYFRSKIVIEAKTTKKVTIPTMRKTSESVSIASVSDEYLDELLKLETITDKQAQILKKIKQMRKDKNQINEQINSEQSNLTRIDQEYQRITQSINVLTSEGDEAKVRAKYVERMNNLFETMEKKRKLVEDLQQKLSTVDDGIYEILDEL
ncbi:MAG: hypothetical protein HeimAB125_20620 [Candidatus Heimdallarchaeota archaeon AB_125]|nr:MAG: hypothetical protein HeimAB125_20620 [Candidatus Heimdallarchaeota archaeon AB_125]